MDFLAGAMTSGAIVSLFFFLLTGGAMHAMAARMKSLEESVRTRSKRDVYDDADYWKHGRTEEDDE